MIKRLLFLIGFFSSSFTLLEAQTPAMPDMTGRVIVKVRPEFRSLCIGNDFHQLPKIKPILDKLSVKIVERKFPFAEFPEGGYGAGGQKMVDITLMYEIQFDTSISVSDAAAMLMSSGNFVYACSHRVPQLLYTPNDPDTATNNQYYLKKILAYQAWDINQGDTNVVVGINDTGVDLDHPDLLGNIKYNYNDPINGIDDDHDGYIDNYYGWDLANKDNDPSLSTVAPANTKPYHGTVLSGLSSAKTNNGIGIAGTGFKCKFLPIKVQDDASGGLTAAFDGIVYAADHGCKIINCSWGGPGAPNPAEQDIINYAAINKGCLVLAASGNSNNEDVYYPASYNNTLSVSGTDINDKKTGIATYGSAIGLCAPGSSIYSTFYDDIYARYFGGNGTSYSCAIASGAAALVKSQYPNYTGIQIREQLRLTADQIDGLPQNVAYVGKLGYGRINLYRALTTPGLPSIRMVNYQITDNNNSLFVSGDTIRIACKFKNLLNNASQAIAMISSPSPYVKLYSSIFYLGPLKTNDSTSNALAPFQIILTGNIPPNTTIPIKLIYNDLGYYDTQTIGTITTGNNYLNLLANDINTTLGANSSIGYTQKPITGIGFKYKASASISPELGLMIGTDSLHLVDNIHSIAGKRDSDFVEQMAVRKLAIPVKSDEDYIQVFNDDSAQAKKLGINITQQIHAWKNSPNNKYITIDYRIINSGPQTRNNLFVGLYSNWDVLDANANKAGYVDSVRLAYVYNPQQANLYAGIQLLKPTKANVYNMDLIPGGSGGIDATSNFSLAKKFTALSTIRTNAGQGSNGNDIAQVLSAGPFQLKSGDTAQVSFALLAGDNLNDLIKSAHKADSIYNYKKAAPKGIVEEKMNNLISIYPNPANDVLNFIVQSSHQEPYIIEVYNTLGQLMVEEHGVLTPGVSSIKINASELFQAIYYYKFTAAHTQSSGKVLIAKP